VRKPSARAFTGTGAFACLLALGLGLRLGNAAWGSLKLDDFHSLHHARALDLREFFASLARDNHPPLSFLLVRAARAFFGEGTWALRLPSLLAGMCAFPILWRVGARLPCPGGRLAALALLAVSTLHIEISSDVRMYALLALAGAGLLEGLLARLEDGRGAWRIVLWTVVGLHTHYHFLYTLFTLGSATALVALADARYRAALRGCLAALALAGLLSAPWYLAAFPRQLAHGLAPGGSDASSGRLFEGFKNMVFLNVSVAGPTLRWVGLAASALLLALAVLGAGTLVRRARAGGRPALAWLCSASAFFVPVIAWGAAHLSPRAGFDWRYLSGALPALCLVIGSEACASGVLARWRRGAVPAVVVCALAVALPNVRDPGGEDYRGAIDWILDQASAGDGVVAADWQPAVFPHSLAWTYYAPRLARGRAVPGLLEYTDKLALVDSAALEGRERVLCCLRSVQDRCAILRVLRRHFGREEIRAFGHSVYVHAFTRS
jgi:4-amino-4-deoxy-L-arabinose transferase-like glycosyltransferase